MSSNLLESVEQDNSPAGDHLRLTTNKTEPELKLIKGAQKFPLRTSTHVYKQQIEDLKLNESILQYISN